ncbi:hypothetical protein GCM10009551_023640 [Nocardiopsis tropica]
MPTRTGTEGRVGSVRAVQATASARTSRSTRNFTFRLTFRTTGSTGRSLNVAARGVSVGLPEYSVDRAVDSAWEPARIP